MAIVPTACAVKVGEVLQSSQGAIELWTNEAGAVRQVVPGITEIKLPVGVMSDTGDVKQSNAIGTTITGNVSFEPVPFKADWYYADDAMRELYQRCICQSGTFSDLWIYGRLNLSDRSRDIIFIPNTAPVEWGGQGAGKGLAVASFQIPAAATNAADWYKVDGNMVQSARFIMADVNLEDTGTEFTATATTIDRTTGSFVDDGIEVGQKIYWDDTDVSPGLNFGRIVTVASVVALSIGIVETSYLEVQVASPTTWLRSGFQM